MMAKAPSGGSFTPASLTNLILWGEADTNTYTDTGGTTLCTTDGDNLKNWKDLSGAGSNLVWPSVLVAPVYKTNLANSKPGCRFSSALDDLLDSAQANNQKPISAAAVVRVTDVTANGTIFEGNSGTGGFALDISASHFRALSAFVALIGGSTATLVNNTFYIVVFTYDSSGNYAFTLNGSADGSGTNNMTFSNTGTRIGCNNATSGGFLDGDLLAFAKGSAVWTGTEITNLTNYWKSKYGL